MQCHQQKNTLFVGKGYLALLDHGFRGMSFHLGDDDGFWGFGNDLLVVLCPEVTVVVQWPWSGWELLMLRQAMYIPRPCRETLAVCAQMDGAISSNSNDGCCQLHPRGRASKTSKVCEELKAFWMLVDDSKGSFRIGKELQCHRSGGPPNTCPSQAV